MMKKVLLTVAATAALAAAVPTVASAQSYDRDGRGGYDQRRDYDRRGDYRGSYQRQRWDNGTRRDWARARQIDQRQAFLDQRVENLVRRRVLDPAEARGIQSGLNQVERLERAYKRDRDLSRKEFQHLTQMLNRLEWDINRRART